MANFTPWRGLASPTPSQKQLKEGEFTVITSSYNGKCGGVIRNLGGNFEIAPYLGKIQGVSPMSFVPPGLLDMRLHLEEGKHKEAIKDAGVLKAAYRSQGKKIPEFPEFKLI